MANPLYGQNKKDSLLQDMADLFNPEQLGKVEGKGFISNKASITIAGEDTTSAPQLFTIGVDTSVWGGFVRVEGIGNASGSLDFDLGVSAGAGEFGTGYGTEGDGVYALKAHDFIDVSSSEDIHLSIDANTYATSVSIVITVFLLTAAAPASS